MLTREEIIEMAETHKRSKWSQVEFSADDAARSFELGATWANEQNAAEIARLEAEKAELLRLLNAIHAIASELWVGMHQLDETQKIEMENASKLIEKYAK